MHSYFQPARSNQSHTLSFAMRINEYLPKTNIIPDYIFLIWIGDDITATSQNHILQHKHFNPHATVEVFVVKDMLVANNKWESLSALCQTNNILLTDIHPIAEKFINYYFIQKALLHKEDYVIASDFLRMEIMYEKGGWYFDVDFAPIAPITIKNPAYGLYQAYESTNTYNAIFGFHAAVKEHFIYKYSALLARYLSQCSENLPPTILASNHPAVRSHLIMLTTGNALNYLRSRTSLESIRGADGKFPFPYNLTALCKNVDDTLWLQNDTQESDTRVMQHVQYMLKASHYWLRSIDDTFMYELEHKKLKAKSAVSFTR